MINSLNFYNLKNLYFNNVSFGTNRNTRQILDDMEDDEFVYSGYPKTQEMTGYRKESKKSNLEKVGEYLAYRGCSRKRRYETDNEAAMGIKKLYKHASKRIRGTLTMYHCDLCNGWHICKAKNKFRHEPDEE